MQEFELGGLISLLLPLTPLPPFSSLFFLFLSLLPPSNFHGILGLGGLAPPTCRCFTVTST